MTEPRDQSISEIWNNSKWNDINLVGVLQREEKEMIHKEDEAEEKRKC